MDFEFTEKEEAFRQEVRSWLKQELTQELQEELKDWTFIRLPANGGGPHLLQLSKKISAKGWFGINMPQEYGGQGRSLIEEFIFYEELAYHGITFPNQGATTMVGPTILQYGTEQQRQTYLPRIARGEISFAIGLTEPEAGSDLASLQTRAVEVGDYYIINGQKVFSTHAHCADYHWLATRTDLNAPKARGISMFIVDLSSPGITVRPLITMGDSRTNEVFYDEVKVPKENLVGERNHGWRYAMASLDYDRLNTFRIAEYQRHFDELIQYVKQTKYAGKELSSDARICHKLAEIAIELEVVRLLQYQIIWMLSNDISTGYRSNMYKVFASELGQRLVQTALEILGPLGQLQQGSKWAPFDGAMELGYRASVMPTFGAGGNEILRSAIATRGLGLPI